MPAFTFEVDRFKSFPFRVGFVSAFLFILLYHYYASALVQVGLSSEDLIWFNLAASWRLIDVKERRNSFVIEDAIERNEILKCKGDESRDFESSVTRALQRYRIQFIIIQ